MENYYEKEKTIREKLHKNYIKRRESLKKNYYEKTIGEKTNNCLGLVKNQRCQLAY